MKNVEDGLRDIYTNGHQNNIIDKMQTRKDYTNWLIMKNTIVWMKKFTTLILTDMNNE